MNVPAAQLPAKIDPAQARVVQEVLALAKPMAKTDYGRYLVELAKEHRAV